MKTILITGINGFLGSHLAKYLKKEYSIIGLEYSLDNLYRLVGEEFKIYTSKENLEKIFKENKIDSIIHAATIYRRSKEETLEKLINTNILLPVKLFEYANKYNCKLFLNTDSFFNNPKYKYSYLPDYTLSKRQVLEWLKFLEDGCKLVNMKIFHMYGPDDSPNKFIPSMIKKLKNNEIFINLTKGEQKRDFIYVQDVAKAFYCVLKNENKIDSSFEFEVGTGKTYSIKELVLTLKLLTKSKTDFNFGMLAYRHNEMMNVVADNSKLKKYNWSPDFTLKEGLSHTIHSY